MTTTRGLRPSDRESLEAIFAWVTVAESVQLLDTVFEATHSFVEVDSHRQPLHTVLDNFPEVANMLAKDVVVKFYGGPPKHSNWIMGSFRTMLLDHAMYNLSIGKSHKVVEAIRILTRRGVE
jgi:hypothetical protein